MPDSVSANAALLAARPSLATVYVSFGSIVPSTCGVADIRCRWMLRTGSVIEAADGDAGVFADGFVDVFVEVGRPPPSENPNPPMATTTLDSSHGDSRSAIPPRKMSSAIRRALSSVDASLTRSRPLSFRLLYSMET